MIEAVTELLCGLLCGLLCRLLCRLFAGLFAGLPLELWPKLLEGVSSMIGACDVPTTAEAFCGGGVPCPCVGVAA